MRTPWWIFLAAVCLLTSCASNPRSLPPLLAFHVQTEEQDDSRTLRVALMDPPAIIRVEKYPWLTEEDVEIATVQKDGKVLLTLTSEGRSKLAELTRDNQGHILVIAFNQRVVYAPIMTQIIDRGSFEIPYGLSPQDVDYLNEVIDQKKAWKK